MADVMIQGSVVAKAETEEYWNSLRDLIPRNREVVFYLPDAKHNFLRIKIGDGRTYLIDLPFSYAQPDWKETDTTSPSYIKNKPVIQSKTTAEWNAVVSYIPDKDDILIYTDREITSGGISIPGIKYGDGLSPCVDLPFITITESEREFWNNKVSCYIKDTLDNSKELVFTTGVIPTNS